MPIKPLYRGKVAILKCYSPSGCHAIMPVFRKAAGKLLRRSRVAVFGNNRPATVNLLYKAYQLKARRNWDLRDYSDQEPYRSSADELARNGYLVFRPDENRALCARLARRAGTLLDTPGVTLRDESQGIIRLKDSLERLPELTELLTGPIEKVVEFYYRSYFKLYSTDVYRLIHCATAPEESFLWHCDNAPAEMIKLLVYLSDTTEETGAFRLKDKTVSSKLKRQGFWDRADTERFADRLEDAASTRVLGGPLGTGILFQHSACIHKATDPARGQRDVAAFLIIPSDVPWREHLARHSNRLSRNYGICLNPFTDRPERVGDE